MSGEPANTLGEVDYYNRTLPRREHPFETFSMLLSAGAIVFGLAALYFTPFKPGFLAIFLGILGLATAGDRDRFGRIALVVAGTCWLIGGLVAVIADQPVW
jgi:hypothetical protein